MVRANLAEFKARMAHFVRLLKRGERVVLCERNVPIATLVPESSKPRSRRPIGEVRWDFKVPDEVWKPLTDEELKALFGDVFS